MTITREDLAGLNGHAADVATHLQEAARMAKAATDAAQECPPNHVAAGSASAAATAHATTASAMSAAAKDAADIQAGAAAKPAAGQSATTNLIKAWPKARATGVGTAIAYVFWTVAAATFWKHTYSSGKLNLLIAATAAVVTAVLGYVGTYLKNRKASGGTATAPKPAEAT